MPAAWHAGDYMSVKRLNAASLHQMTGEEALNLAEAFKSQGMKIFITQDSPDSTLRADNYYTLSNDLGTWNLDGLSSHTHRDQTSGGAHADTLRANIPLTINLDKRFAKAAQFYTAIANNGSVQDDQALARIIIDTSATNAGRASIFDGGARALDFAKSSAFESTLKQSSDTNFKTKVGINAENIEAVNNPAVPSYGIEGCSSSGTVWLIWSSSGTVRSTLATASPIVTAEPAVYNVEHETANTVTLSIDGVALSPPKSTDIPSTGIAPLNNLYKAGIQNTAAEQKILYHYGGPILVGRM